MRRFDDGADWTFNFDPAKGGANRFATVFLYLSDVEAVRWNAFFIVHHVVFDVFEGWSNRVSYGRGT